MERLFGFVEPVSLPICISLLFCRVSHVSTPLRRQRTQGGASLERQGFGLVWDLALAVVQRGLRLNSCWKGPSVKCRLGSLGADHLQVPFVLLAQRVFDFMSITGFPFGIYDKRCAIDIAIVRVC